MTKERRNAALFGHRKKGSEKRRIDALAEIGFLKEFAQVEDERAGVLAEKDEIDDEGQRAAALQFLFGRTDFFLSLIHI